MLIHPTSIYMMLFPHFELVQFLIHNWNVPLAQMVSWQAKSPFFAEYSPVVDICKSLNATKLCQFVQCDKCFAISVKYF